jgi:hypothetical protein
VRFPIPAVFRAPIGENSKQRNIVFLIKGNNSIIEHVGRYQRILAVVQLGEGHLRVSVDEGLLVNAPDALDGAYVIGVLGPR